MTAINPLISGPMSFNPTMHGSQAFSAPFASFAFGTQPSYTSEEMSEETAKKIAALQAKLNQKLGPEYISQRPGPGGGPKLTYAEGWRIINLANEVFGFNGWSSTIVNIATDFIDYNEESRRYTVGVSAIVRVTLRDGVYHEDVGYGMLENAKSKGTAIDKCKKEAVTDGLKRALRSFGNLLGNCLYDKAYTQEVVKMKVPPLRFDASELHRRPECDVKPNISSSEPINNNSKTKPSNNGMRINDNSAPSHPTPQQKSRAPSFLSPHMRREDRSATDVTTNTNSANTPKAPLQNVPTTPMSIQIPRLINDIKSQQPNQPPQRKVTFSDGTRANPNETTSRPVEAKTSSSKDGELDGSFVETIGFSEEDAFLASIDFSDLDLDSLGQPTEDSGDAGRPIDFDEGLDASTTNSNVATSTTTSARSTSTRTGPATGMLSGLLPQQRQRVSNPPSKEPPWRDENVRPSRPNAQSSGNNERTPPSIGGFHFPPGMNPFEQHGQNGPPAQYNSNFNARAGVKRPAESVSTSYQPGPKRGMGLQNSFASNAGHGNCSLDREILGPLEVGEGGDVKRIRR